MWQRRHPIDLTGNGELSVVIGKRCSKFVMRLQVSVCSVANMTADLNVFVCSDLTCTFDFFPLSTCANSVNMIRNWLT
jgi:hypothetical protein